MLPKKYNLPPNASDQLRETVEQVNLRLSKDLISQEKANELIMLARHTEGLSNYFGTPLENRSAQTLKVEAQRTKLLGKEIK